MKKHFVRKPVTAAMSVSKFLDWHDDDANYSQRPEAYDQIYKILDKYPDPDDNVGEQYAAASQEDKEAITRIVEGNTMSSADVLQSLLSDSLNVRYTMSSSKLTLRGARGLEITLDLSKIPADVINRIADI